MTDYTPQTDPTLNPLYHLNNPAGFMNDIQTIWEDDDGLYHVYYLNNPSYGESTGDKGSCWQEATSSDLINWDNSDVVAIYARGYDDSLPWGTVATGSCVKSDGTILGTNRGDIVAYFSSYGAPNCGGQSIWMAVSTDNGKTFHSNEYSAIDKNTGNLPDFRDCQVFKFNDKWMMYIAEGSKIEIRSSTDGVNFTTAGWQFLDSGQFLNGEDYGLIECPYAVQLTANDGTTHAVLFFGNNDYHHGHGTGTSYLLGQFKDGVFVNDYYQQVPIRIDFGTDYYGANFGVMNNGDFVSTAWASSWGYATANITGINGQTYHRGSVANFRKLKLVKTDDGYKFDVKPMAYNAEVKSSGNQFQVGKTNAMKQAVENGQVVDYTITPYNQDKLTGVIHFNFNQGDNAEDFWLDFDKGAFSNQRFSNIINDAQSKTNYSNSWSSQQIFKKLINPKISNIRFYLDTSTIEVYFVDLDDMATYIRIGSINNPITNTVVDSFNNDFNISWIYSTPKKSEKPSNTNPTAMVSDLSDYPKRSELENLKNYIQKIVGKGI